MLAKVHIPSITGYEKALEKGEFFLDDGVLVILEEDTLHA